MAYKPWLRNLRSLSWLHFYYLLLEADKAFHFQPSQPIIILGRYTRTDFRTFFKFILLYFVGNITCVLSPATHSPYSRTKNESFEGSWARLETIQNKKYEVQCKTKKTFETRFSLLSQCYNFVRDGYNINNPYNFACFNSRRFFIRSAHNILNFMEDIH